MKTKNILATLLILLSISQFTYSQEAPAKLKVPGFGVGLHIEQFRLGDLLNDNLPVNSFIFTGNINNVFRIEPEIGFYSRTSKGSASGDPDLTSSATKMALGLYYIFQKENFNFSVGALLENNSLSEENINGNSEVYTNKTKSFGFGPSLCGEYFFGKHFSFGGNLALLFSSQTYTPSTSTGGNESKSSSSQTLTGLQARFYF